VHADRPHQQPSSIGGLDGEPVTHQQSAPALIEVARYRVIFADCDAMRIMYYGNYFRLFEIGRAELFRQLGHPFPRYIARGLYLGVIEATCRYIKPARYDDELVIRAGVTDIGRARMTIGYEVVGADGLLLVSGHTVLAALNEDGRPQRIPPEFKEAAIGFRAREA
jgi:acyl-CoA thioester hydrolase